MSENRSKIGVSKERGQFGPRFKLRYHESSPTNRSSYYKNEPFIWYKNFGRRLLHFVGVHAFVGRPDRFR